MYRTSSSAAHEPSLSHTLLVQSPGAAQPCTHWPRLAPVSLHFGVPALRAAHSASSPVEQARHIIEVGSQSGVATEHSLWLVHGLTAKSGGMVRSAPARSIRVMSGTARSSMPETAMSIETPAMHSRRVTSQTGKRGSVQVRLDSQ